MHRWPLLCALLTLAACGGGRVGYGPGLASYPEPGPPGDPWRPYIRQAANRFSVPQRWIRAVMQQESGGHEYRDGRAITSPAGAMGLMQLMPATYADMQSQNGLGNDPYEPHDNILAGTAYIRLMYARYGAPAFLAAYNAGPQRLDDYLGTGRRLPNETVRYVAAIAPRLGTEIAMTGPLSAYAGVPDRPAPSFAASVRLAAYRVPAPEAATACAQDPDAAYDPDLSCRPARRVRRAEPPVAMQVAATPVSAIYQAPGFYRTPSASRREVSYSVEPYGAWAVQVGAYDSAGQAHFATTMARQAAFTQLSGSRALVQPTSRFGRTVLYRARLAGLARADAGAACQVLEQHSIPCMIVAPGS